MNHFHLVLGNPLKTLELTFLCLYYIILNNIINALIYIIIKKGENIMKLVKKALSVLAIVLSLIIVVPVTIPEISESYIVNATTIKLNKKNITLNVGKTYALKITGTNKKVTWSSNKKSVATVNSKGKITAKKKGTAKITAKVGNKKYTCTVKVNNTSSQSVYITNTGKKYHRSSCFYLRKSKIKISLSNAKSRGYTACSKCRP